MMRPLPSRLLLLRIVLGAWALLAWARLAQVQLVQHAQWSSEATRQQERVVEVAAPRGTILSRDGRVLAGSLERVRVGVSAGRIPASQRTDLAARLAPLVGLSQAEVLQRLSGNGFCYLGRELDPRIRTDIAALGSPAIWTEPTERRIYPHGTLAGPTIGFVNGEGVGQAGLEASFENTLRGVASRYRLISDSIRTALDLILEREGRPGLAVRVTIDSRIQALVEDELGRAIDEIGAGGAAAAVLDPATGEVLALASLPSYDPGRPGAVDAPLRRNRAVEDAIEPGSTIKPLIVGAALQAGVLGARELVDCSGGGVQVAGFFIADHASYGLLPVRDVLAQSSNAGTIRIAHRLAPAQLDGVLRAFGMGAQTGIELPAEATGIFRPPARWSALSRAGLAIGQEISASVMQLAQAYCALANGGVLVPPRLVLETADAVTGETVTSYRPHEGRRVLRPEVAAEIAGMLEAVVSEGTGKAAAVPGFDVGGKTGTAQRAIGRGYEAGEHAAWFAGFLPSERPRLVIVVCVDQPRRTFWAADVAAPVFGRIALRVATLLGLSPSRVERV